MYNTDSVTRTQDTSLSLVLHSARHCYPELPFYNRKVVYWSYLMLLVYCTCWPLVQCVLLGVMCVSCMVQSVGTTED